VKEWIPKEFQEIADSAYDHIGTIIETTPIEIIAGGLLGLSTGIKLNLEPERILALAASGMFAAKGLSSDSEAVGAASIATLAALGAAVLVDLETVKSQIVPLVEEYKETRNEAVKKSVLSKIWATAYIP